MKHQILGIFFYLLYLLAMVKPLVPIMEYYANYNYIATILCENKDKPYLECNGKCYLQKQLNEVNHTNHEHKSTVPQINFDDYPITTLDTFSYNLASLNIFVTNNHGNFNEAPISFNYSLFKPPQTIS